MQADTALNLQFRFGHKQLHLTVFVQITGSPLCLHWLISNEQKGHSKAEPKGKKPISRAE